MDRLSHRARLLHRVPHRQLQSFLSILALLLLVVFGLLGGGGLSLGDCMVSVVIVGQRRASNLPLLELSVCVGQVALPVHVVACVLT